MKNIFCPTDFSEQANHAVEAGYYLARQFGADLHLFNVVEAEDEVDFNVTGPSTNLQSMDDVFFLKLIDMTKKRMAELENTTGLEDIKVTSEIKIGSPSKIIFKEIESGKYDMVVMGTKGVSGFSEVLIGSNAEKIVRKSKVPVLSVKNFVEESNFKRIVYASTFSEDEEMVVNSLKTIQEAFNSTIHLVRVNTPNNFQPDWVTMQQMDEFVRKFKLEQYTFNIYNDAIEEDGIIYFAEEMDAGMIAMATHGRTGFAHLLSGSIAEDVVNHSKRPVFTYNLQK